MKGAPALPVPTEATELLRLHRLAQDRRGIQPNSIEKREQYLRAFARWLDPRGLLDASRQDVELFLDKRRTQEGRKIQSDTRYYWIAHFHSFYKWAMLEELIEADPTVAIVRPKTRRTLPRPIEGDDLVMAVRGARPEMRAMLSLAAFAGLRCQEIAGLDRDDIIEAKGLIRVRYGKGAKERISPAPPGRHGGPSVPAPPENWCLIRPAERRPVQPQLDECLHRSLLARDGHQRVCASVPTLVRDRDLRRDARHSHHTGAARPFRSGDHGGVHRIVARWRRCSRGVAQARSLTHPPAMQHRLSALRGASSRQDPDRRSSALLRTDGTVHRRQGEVVHQAWACEGHAGELIRAFQ